MYIHNPDKTTIYTHVITKRVIYFWNKFSDLIQSIQIDMPLYKEIKPNKDNNSVENFIIKLDAFRKKLEK